MVNQRLQDLKQRLTEEDLETNATLQSLDRLAPMFTRLDRDRDRINTVVDLGCGRGGLARVIGDYVDADEVHGIEIDPVRRDVAEDREITIYDLDLSSERLPFDDGEVDLVLNFGLLEHLTSYDHPIEETHRVLRDGGYTCLSLPNLGSWLNRIALLLGNQPRDVEISEEKGFGIMRFYPTDEPLGHVHSATYSAVNELLTYHGFTPVESAGLHPYQDATTVSLIDRLVSFRPSLCRRFAILAEKSS